MHFGAGERWFAMKGTSLVALAVVAGTVFLARINAQTADNSSAKGAIEQYVRDLGSTDKAVRGRAYVALVKIGEPAIPALIRALGDGRADVRRAAIYAIGRIGDPAIAALARMARGPETPTQKAALSTVTLLLSSGNASEKTQQTLRQRFPKAVFSGEPLELVVEFHRQAAKVPIFVHWRGLQKAGIQKKSPVRTAVLRNATARDCLSACLASVSTKRRVDYRIIRGILVISTEDGLKGFTELGLWEFYREVFADDASVDLRRRMRQILPKLDFARVPLSLVFRFMEETATVEFSVDWAALRQAGVSKTTPVNVHLTDVSLANALTYALVDASGYTNLRYRYSKGKLVVFHHSPRSSGTTRAAQAVRPNIPPKVQKQLKMAEVYRSTGMKERAAAICRSVIKTCPEAAPIATKMLKEMGMAASEKRPEAKD